MWETAYRFGGVCWINLSCSHALYLLPDGLAHLSRRRRTSEIGCVHLPFCQNLFDGTHKESGRLLLEDLVPEDHIVLHAVGLGGAGNLFATILPGILEGIAHDPLRALASKDSRLDGHFVLCPLVHAAPGAGIFAFGILTHAHD